MKARAYKIILCAQLIKNKRRLLLLVEAVLAAVLCTFFLVASSLLLPPCTSTHLNLLAVPKITVIQFDGHQTCYLSF